MRGGGSVRTPRERGDISLLTRRSSVPLAFLRAVPYYVLLKSGPWGSGDLGGGLGPARGQLEAGGGSPWAARATSCLGLGRACGLGSSLEVLVNS